MAAISDAWSVGPRSSYAFFATRPDGVLLVDEQSCGGPAVLYSPGVSNTVMIFVSNNGCGGTVSAASGATA